MNGFLVTVEGDFFGASRSGDRKREKYPYRIQVKVPSPEGALSLIKNKLLDKVLRRNYDNYFAFRTHQLVSITQLDGSKVYGLTDPRLMDFNDLAAYVKQNNLPLKLELYTDLGYFRTMVHLAQTNQREFLIKQANLAKDSEEDKLLAELNPELDTAQPLSPVSTEKLITAEEAVENLKAAVKAENAVRDTTVITEGERATVEAQSADGAMNLTVDAPASNMITEDKPDAQKVDKVYIPGKGFVSADSFKEDFEKVGEEEFEVYDPTNMTPAPSEEIEKELNVDKPMTATEAVKNTEEVIKNTSASEIKPSIVDEL